MIQLPQRLSFGSINPKSKLASWHTSTEISDCTCLMYAFTNAASTTQYATHKQTLARGLLDRQRSCLMMGCIGAPISCMLTSMTTGATSMGSYWLRTDLLPDDACKKDVLVVAWHAAGMWYKI
jgi:hypothetical protein